MYNTRFDYNDPIYQSTVERDQETITLLGSASIQVLQCDLMIIRRFYIVVLKNLSRRDYCYIAVVVNIW